jgi:hypothetical protein
MKIVHSMIAALGLAFVLPAAADAGVNDPEVIIYRFPGVRDNGGGANTGMSTVFHCTNFSGVVEKMRFVARDFDSTILANIDFTISHLFTLTVGTHFSVLYNEQLSLNTGVVQGTAAIAATSTSIICTAMTIDASSAVPNGFALRGIRFNPVPGSQE